MLREGLATSSAVGHSAPMRIAITGSTGSLGSALITALAEREDVTRIVALSRDEVKSGDLAERWASLPTLRCQLADVRDEQRLEEVFRGCDVVIHAAALKRVTLSVYSPEEIIKTNVQGTINVIRAATEVGVAKVLVVSSDKAVEPTNLYGMTKAVAEAYAVQANSYSRPRGVSVSVVRYGNVLGSRGSVVGVWRAALASGSRALDIMNINATRFIITLRDAAAFCLRAVRDMEGGEVFVPRLPAAYVRHLGCALMVEAGLSEDEGAFRSVGLRPGGEKLHEALLSREEPPRAYRLYGADRMVVLPSHHSWRAEWSWPSGAFEIPGAYTSDAPDRWLGVDDLVEMLKKVP